MTRLKNIFIFIFLFVCHTAYLQSETSRKPIQCDSLLMVDGTIKMVKIIEQKKKKLIYTLCCEECAVPREIRLSEISRIIQIPEIIDKDIIIEVLSAKNPSTDTSSSIVTPASTAFQDIYIQSTFYVEDQAINDTVLEKNIDDKVIIVYMSENGKEITTIGRIDQISSSSIVVDSLEIPLASILLSPKRKIGKILFIRGVSFAGAGVLITSVGTLLPDPPCEGFCLGINGMEFFGGLVAITGGGLIIISGAVSAYRAFERKKQKKDAPLPVYTFKTFVLE